MVKEGVTAHKMIKFSWTLVILGAAIQLVTCQNYTTLTCQICAEDTSASTSSNKCNTTNIPITPTRSANNTATSTTMCRIWVRGNNTVQKELVDVSLCDNTTLTRNVQQDIPKFTAFTGDGGARCCNWTNCNANFNLAGMANPPPAALQASAIRYISEGCLIILPSAWLIIKKIVKF